jgi:ribosome biogenesis GTPase
MPDAGKSKGTDRYNPRDGMGRLRRASRKGESRISGLEGRTEDENYLEGIEGGKRRVHAGEDLLKAFNRLAQGGIREAAAGVPAELCGFEGRHVCVRYDDGSEAVAEVRQVLKKQVKGVKNPLCVGDRLRVAMEAGGPVVTAVEPRRSQLARADSHNRSLIHVFAANVDRLVIVVALAQPDLKVGLIDRYLMIAAMNELSAVVVLNKADLVDAAVIEPVRALYAGLGVPVFATACRTPGDPGVSALRDELAGQTCVVAGQSGVGKSSLANAMFPQFGARTGSVAGEGFGRHTTTSSKSYLLPGGSRFIDTPGIRECTITGIAPVDVALLMPDLAALHPTCRFNDCTHRHEPDCAVMAAVQAGTLPASRYGSYRSIVDEDLAGV